MTFKKSNAETPERRMVPLFPPNVDPLADAQPGDILGAFSGYLRRCRVASAGLTAQVFGENGEDADIVSSMHLSKFQNAKVRVDIWMVKDAVGQRSWKAHIGYPKLATFVGTIRRPAPSLAGQTAQFFAENGAEADTVNTLNQSSFQDALVRVEIRKLGASDAVLEQIDYPREELESTAQKLTPFEIKSLKSKQRQATEAVEALRRAGFFRNVSVVEALGGTSAYLTWLTETACCQHGDAPCLHPAEPVFLSNLGPGFPETAAVPLCLEHVQQWKEHPGNPDFLQLQGQLHQDRFGHETLLKKLEVPEGFEAIPEAIYTWSVQTGLGSQLPPAFLNLIH